MTANNVFKNVDGTDYPGGATYGWSAQGTATYAGRGSATDVYTDANSAHNPRTPANIAGWTVQSINEGGNYE